MKSKNLVFRTSGYLVSLVVWSCTTGSDPIVTELGAAGTGGESGGGGQVQGPGGASGGSLSGSSGSGAGGSGGATSGGSGSGGVGGEGKSGSAGTAGEGASAGAAGEGGSAGNAGDAGQAGSGGSEAGAGGSGAGAGGSAGEGGAANPCSSCVQDKCKSQLETCQADPNCDKISKCVLDQCLESTTQDKLIQCAFSVCGAGINDQTLLPVTQCAGQQCVDGVCPFATGSGGSGGSTSFDPGVEAGVVTCGPSLGCDVEKDGACCITVSGFQGPEYSCTKGQCNGGFVSIPQPCDGPEDCEGNQVCCGAASQQGSGVSCVSECKPPPNGQAYKLCHKDDDCGAGDSCQVCDVGQLGISILFRVCNSECPSG